MPILYFFCINNNQAQGLVYVYPSPDRGCSLSNWKKLQWENSPLGSLKHPIIWCSGLSIFSLWPFLLFFQPSNRDWSEPFPPNEISPAGRSVRIDCTNVDPKWSFINWQSALMQGRPPEIILFNISTKKQEVIRWKFLLSRDAGGGWGVGAGGHVPLQVLGYQLTLFGPRGADYASNITSATPPISLDDAASLLSYSENFPLPKLSSFIECTKLGWHFWLFFILFRFRILWFENKPSKSTCHVIKLDHKPFRH